MSVTIIYNFRATDGNADELVALLLGGRDFGRTVAGCEGFDVYQDRDDPRNVVMIETWGSAETQRDHLETNVIPSGAYDKVAALLVDPPQARYFVKQ
ncbi:MAG: putative quinol monooxygenase [Acidimicrobiales bacterium]